MVDRLKEIPKKILEWWNKFTTRQKTIIISIAAGVILALAILMTLLTRKTYVTLATCETTAEAAEIVDLLKSNSLDYKTSTDGTIVSVLDSQESQANLLLGANKITADGYTIDDVTSGGFSTTESDKQKRWVYLLQQKMETDLESNSAVKNATVTLDLPENDGTLISQKTEAYAAITLELEGELTEENAAALARFVASALGNETTDNVTIIDTDGNLLFSGEDVSSVGGATATTQLSMKKKAEELVKNEVKSVLLGTDLYDSVEVASNLDLDFSSSQIVDHQYTPADGQTQGVLSHSETYESESTGGTGGVPGTTSNDSDNEPSYVIENYDNSSETVNQQSQDYLPNEKITTTDVPAGLIQYSSSSISVAAKTLHIYKEADVKAQGLLTDMTWEEFKDANKDAVKLDVDADLVTLVQTATGIPAENISIVAYDVPVFIDKDGMNVEASDIIQVVIIVLILGLLAFVILRSMRESKAEETEEELSVESLLQSTPQDSLEDIELEEKSETRKMIEKFVDENPEAVASLLRNWLSEDWG